MVGMGQGPGLPNYDLGEVFGSDIVTLGIDQIPAHDHTFQLVPEPPGRLLAVVGLCGLWLTARRRRD